MRHNLKALLLVCLTALACLAGDSIRPGLEPLETQYSIPDQTEERLVSALREPLLEGRDVTAPLQRWFDGRLLDTQGQHDQAVRAWQDGLKALDAPQTLPLLPRPDWRPIPDATLRTLKTLKLKDYPDIDVDVVEWQVGKLRQYGVLILPSAVRDGSVRLPVILYTHGAAFGVPVGFLSWLADLARQGYVIAGPAMRGEPLFQRDIPINGKLLACEGDIENLDGEVDDCLAMLSATWKLPFAVPGQFAMIGHSFGAGVGLLAAARAADQCRAAVSYDAWLVSPQRYYWDRMARRANNWLSWADFCNQPVPAQLAGLLTRSIVHHADKLKAPLLLFIGGAYQGSVFHQSHDDLIEQLRRRNHPHQYHVMPNAGHNFVLYLGSKPATDALRLQTQFLARHFPPATLPKTNATQTPSAPK